MGNVHNLPVNKSKGIPDILEYLSKSEGVSNIRTYSSGELTDEKLLAESAAVRRLMIRTNNSKHD